MGTGILVLFYTALGCIVALLVGRTSRGSILVALLFGLATVVLIERLFIPLVSWDDPFFWEGTLRLLGLAVIPVLFAAWLGSGFRRKSALEE
jgi:NhaP-type Na+/H+ or K+/H+ antiporter